VVKGISGQDHSRDGAGMKYVYAVESRRAGGVSIGVNLNPNNACNWRCIYCQVSGLTRGAPPDPDLEQLERELRSMIAIAASDAGGIGPRHIEDVAFSGNGESSLSPRFGDAVQCVRRVLREMDPCGAIRLRLITNGSQILHPQVQIGLHSIEEHAGEVWFKVDGGSREAIARINDVNLDPQGVAHRLGRCAELVSTWVQTCVFSLDGQGPDETWLNDYLSLLRDAGTDRLKGVLLYGIARPSMQPEATRLARLSTEEIESIAASIRETGLTVKVSP